MSDDNVITKGFYDLPTQINPDRALMDAYPGLEIKFDYKHYVYNYLMNGKVIFSVHFLAYANYELYKVIEDRIKDYLRNKIDE